MAQWAEYIAVCRRDNVTPHNVPPRIEPLPSNEDAWRAFCLVEHCRAYTALGVGGFDWVGVSVRLGVHGLWRPEIERKLAVCEYAMLKLESDQRDLEKGK